MRARSFIRKKELTHEVCQESRNRAVLRKELEKESKMVRDNSMEVLADFETADP